MVSVDIEIMLYMRRQLGCDKSLGQFIIDKLFMVSIFFLLCGVCGELKTRRESFMGEKFNFST